MDKLTIWKLTKAQLGMLSLGLLIGLITLIAVVLLLAASGWFLTAAGMASAAGAALTFNFFSPGGVVRMAAITRTAGRYGERVVSHEAVLRLLRDLRLWVWDQLTPRLPDRSGNTLSGELLQRAVADIDRLDEWPLRWLAPWFWAVAIVCLSLAVAQIFVPSLVAVIALPIVIAMIAVPLLGRLIGRQLTVKEVEQGGRRRSQLVEALSGLITLQVNNQWQNRQNAIEAEDQSIIAAQRWQALLISTGQLLIGLLLLVSFYLLLDQGAQLVLNEQLNGAWLAAMALGFLALNEILAPLAATFQAAGQSAQARQRLNEMGEIEALHSGGQQTIDTLDTLKLQALTVRQPNAMSGPTDVNATLFAGDKCLLTGPSGAGKTTLAYALARFIPVTPGQVLLNDVDLTELSEMSLRQHVGVLEQSPHLFNQSLAANLRLGNPSASDEELWDVLKQVSLYDWAQSLPEQLLTNIGEYGTGVSGGQARRIGLARLMLQAPSLVVVDEPLEGLDGDNQKLILDQLLSLPAMLIMISHHDVDVDRFDHHLKLDAAGKMLQG
ncbi:thiol reductant ABC exporter subunit CydC [Salinibius halmophilus]|uniref:thiol reductant ABC exporter subunit CydC n=1 Tax=Salinibius halmophilus TaxID=1853216 RepID=UPI000E6751EC|nr:thiol reductant ABC exporter subunit CydC [Salinibius halmophilus]